MSTSSSSQNNGENCDQCCRSLPLSIFSAHRDPNDPNYPEDIYPTPTYFTECEKGPDGNRRPVDRYGNVITSVQDLGRQVASLFAVDSKCEEDLANLFNAIFNQQMNSILFDCASFPNHCIVWRVISNAGGPIGGGPLNISVCCDCNGMTAYDTLLQVGGFLIPCEDIDDWLDGTIPYPP